MTQDERSTLMQRARQARRNSARPPTEVARDHARDRGRQRQGRRRQVVGDRQPRGRARRARPHRRRARRRHLGLLDPAHARRHAAGSRARRPTTARARSSRRRSPLGAGHAARSCRWGCSSTTRTPRSMWRGPDPRQGARAVPHRRAVGRPRLSADRHAARHRRHPDGAVALAAAGRDARRHHARQGCAEGRGARRRHGAPLVHEGARCGREHVGVRRARRQPPRDLR